MINIRKQLPVIVIALVALMLIALWGIRKVNYTAAGKFDDVTAELSLERTEGTLKTTAFRGLLNETKRQGGEFFTIELSRRKVILKPSSEQFKPTFDRILNYSEPTAGVLEFQRDYKNDSLDFVVVPYENIMSMLDFIAAGVTH